MKYYCELLLKCSVVPDWMRNIWMSQGLRQARDWLMKASRRDMCLNDRSCFVLYFTSLHLCTNKMKQKQRGEAQASAGWWLAFESWLFAGLGDPGLKLLTPLKSMKYEDKYMHCLDWEEEGPHLEADLSCTTSTRHWGPSSRPGWGFSSVRFIKWDWNMNMNMICWEFRWWGVQSEKTLPLTLKWKKKH